MDREGRKRESWHSVLRRYLIRRRTALLLFLACAGIFALVFSLYDLELEAVLYAGALCLLLLLAVLAADFFRIEQYVEMVLSYLRLDSDSSDYVFQEYELDGIIRQAIHKYAPLFVRKKLKLSYEPTKIRVLTDEKWLLFILEQILSNSIKYTREGTISITVTPEKVLKISDTGIGIAPEDLPRIFEKGFTGYNGRSDKKSTGLGLYLCKKAAGRLSHGLKAESEPGAGTTVFIDLHTERVEAE